MTKSKLSVLYNSLVNSLDSKYAIFSPPEQFFLNTFNNRVLNLITPFKTLSISLTGTACSQGCAHCNGHYLKGMNTLQTLSRHNLDEYDAVLVSGGSDTQDLQVPISAHIAEIMQLPQHLKLNIHPGFQSPQNLLPLCERELFVSFDLPCSDDVVQKILKLDKTAQDFKHLFMEYNKLFNTVPHVTIGLSKIDKSEEAMIDFLKTQNPDQVVFIVFRPTPGTELECKPVPEISRIIEVLAYAYQELNCKIVLGCMRPAGSHRRNLDILAWVHGIDSIVMPSKKLMKILKQNQIAVHSTYNCCAFG